MGVIDDDDGEVLGSGARTSVRVMLSVRYMGRLGL